MKLTSTQIMDAARQTAKTPQRTSDDVLALNNLTRREQIAYRNTLRISLAACIMSDRDRAIDERHLAILNAILGN